MRSLPAFPASPGDRETHLTGRSRRSLPLRGPETVIHVINPPRVSSPFLPSLRKVCRTGDHIPQRIHYSVMASCTVSVSRQQTHHDLSFNRERVGTVCQQI